MVTLSVVVPVKDEHLSLSILHAELTHELQTIKKPYEILYIDDGSVDASPNVLKSIQKKDNNVRVIRFRANFGKSAALSVGFKHAKGSIIVTMDADLQDDPRDLPKLLAQLDKGYDVVCGWRKLRQDTLSKRLSSCVFNKATALVTGVPLHDVNASFKVLKHLVCERLSVHGELHRFIPIIAAKQKFRVTEVPVNNRKRRFGQSKYGLERSWRGMIDLFTTLFLTDYAEKPAHFFGKIGLLFFITGFIMDAYVSYLRITTGSTQDRLPLLLAGILFMVLGVQLLSTGLIAEMIIHENPKSDPPYIIV